MDNYVIGKAGSAIYRLNSDVMGINNRVCIYSGDRVIGDGYSGVDAAYSRSPQYAITGNQHRFHGITRSAEYTDFNAIVIRVISDEIVLNDRILPPATRNPFPQ